MSVYYCVAHSFMEKCSTNGMMYKHTEKRRGERLNLIKYD